MRKVLVTALSALLAAISAVLGSPLAHADNSVVNGVNLESAPAFGPGVVWWGNARGKSWHCSAGIPAHRGTTNMVISAGHCADTGSAVTTDLAGRGGEIAGTVIYSQNGSIDAAGDYSVLQMKDTIPLTSSIPGLSALSSALTADDLETSYPDLCVLGTTTGLTCGSFVRVLPNRTAVEFRAPVDEGDSGGTVFAVRNDGTAVAVGTLVSYMDGDKTLAAAQLVAPVLQQQGLSLGFV